MNDPRQSRLFKQDFRQVEARVIARLSPDDVARLPYGFKAPLDNKTTQEILHDRGLTPTGRVVR